MARPEGTSRALVVDLDVARFTIDAMPLDLAGVVRHIEQQLEMRPWEQRRKDLARQMTDDLPIGNRAVNSSAHGALVALPDRRID